MLEVKYIDLKRSIIVENLRLNCTIKELEKHIQNNLSNEKEFINKLFIEVPTPHFIEICDAINYNPKTLIKNIFYDVDGDLFIDASNNKKFKLLMKNRINSIFVDIVNLTSLFADNKYCRENMIRVIKHEKK